ncbi:universal stress protein uspa-like protein [Halogeometricum borinquense DSM 11551]|uniref:Universal stress protein UspA-like protein n=2 Tax=Halogeometricum borinquense TaxID=60847 RepID=E4NNW3_HALBP|nr:universal stress protein [Halogeometricum borinquense]ADQ66394.1 universal stress protein UspA-like protein [Halogeometricum borinquense DSM 11551]ELY31114.1 universal stress protein uspa-like protein [Halogeometricum borinquense DSM 11551]RYJ15205.1 universal stress protein [Halogeometricum borinquense]
MAHHLLLPVDGSPQSVEALRFAASEWGNANVTLLNVINPIEAGYRLSAFPAGSEEWYEAAREQASTVFEDAKDELSPEMDIDTRIEVGRPAATILEVAREGEVDHIVIGSHGREGISRILLGSVAEAIVRRSPVPVTVVH